MYRRDFLRAAGSTLIMPLGAGLCRPAVAAQDIRLLVGFAAGGSADAIARLTAQALSEQVRRPVIVENRTGASATVAAGTVARAAPDGNTLLLASSGHSLSGALYSNLTFDPVKDFTGIAGSAATPVVYVVRKDSPIKTIQQLVEMTRAKPGELNYGDGGNTTLMAMSAALLKRQVGLDATWVPFTGTAHVANALLGGNIDFGIDTLAGAMGLLRDDVFRALAIGSQKRSPLLPDVPTIAETLIPGFDVVSWFGVLAPAATSAATVEGLSSKAREGLGQSAIKARMATMGFEPLELDAAGFTKLLVSESQRWTALVRELNIKR